jgi:hypothetical protein
VVRLRGYDELQMAADESADEEEGEGEGTGGNAGSGDWAAAAQAALARTAEVYPDTPEYVAGRRNNVALCRALLTIDASQAQGQSVALVRLPFTAAFAPAALVDRAGTLVPAARAADARLRLCVTFALPLIPAGPP